MKNLFALATALLCASLYFLWVNAGVRQIAMFPYKPNQIAVALVLIIGVASMLLPARRKAMWSLVKGNQTFLVVFSAFLVLQLMTVIWAAPHGNFAYVLGKQAGYFLCALFVAAALTGNTRHTTMKAVYWGLLGGLAVFTAVFTYLSAILGSGVAALVTGALLDGDASALQFKVFTLLFNFSDGELIGKGDADFQGTALRNTLVGVFVVTSVLFWSRTENALSGRFVGSPYATVAVTLLCGFFTIASVSRSNILVFVIAGTVVAVTSLFYQSSQAKSKQRSRWFLLLAGLAVLLASGNLFVGFVQGLATIGIERFGNFANEPRWIMYGEALRGVEEDILLGHGLGAEIESFGHRVHNLFLAAWYEGGIALFFSSVAMYIALLRTVVVVHQRSIVLRRFGRGLFLLAPGGVLALSILPLFRPLISGEAGAFTLVEWFCVAVLLAERANARAAIRQIRAVTY